jgi:hypothetical protein
MLSWEDISKEVIVVASAIIILIIIDLHHQGQTALAGIQVDYYLQ